MPPIMAGVKRAHPKKPAPCFLCTFFWFHSEKVSESSLPNCLVKKEITKNQFNSTRLQGILTNQISCSTWDWVCWRTVPCSTPRVELLNPLFRLQWLSCKMDRANLHGKRSWEMENVNFEIFFFFSSAGNRMHRFKAGNRFKGVRVWHCRRERRLRSPDMTITCTRRTRRACCSLHSPVSNICLP